MMGGNKGNWGKYSLQAFGISVLGPLLFYLINPIIEHFKGNRDAVAYIKTYVSQWDSIKITLPNNLFEQMMQKGSIRVKTLVSDNKGKHRIAVDNKIFYLPQYKKFFEIIWINGVDNIVGLYNRHHDAAGVQNGLMRAGWYYQSMSIANNGRINHTEQKKSQCQSFYIELSQVMI